MEIRELAIKARESLDSRKGEDIEIIRIGDRTIMAEYMVLASASNERLLGALANEVEDTFKKMDIFPRGVEGKKEAGWILLDFGDIIVNILTREMREKYNIEKIWMDCERVD